LPRATPEEDDPVHDRPIHETMRELGVRLDDVARRAGVGVPCISRQLHGERTLQPGVRAAIREALLARAAASLPMTAMLLRRHGEHDAAEACERLRERLAGEGTG